MWQRSAIQLARLFLNTAGLSVWLLCGIDVSASDPPKHLSASERASQMHSAVLKGRKHPSYQVFAAQIKLPEIRGGESEVIILGEEAFTFRVGEEPSAEQKAALCDALKLPPSALSAILKDLPPQANGSMVASQFKTALIDYFYLLERWNAYRPGPGKEEVKLQALKELEEGNLAQAWLQYSLLPKPAPPGSSLGPATTP